MFVKYITGISSRIVVCVDHGPLIVSISQDMEPTEVKRKLFRLFLSIGIPALLRGDQWGCV